MKASQLDLIVNQAIENLDNTFSFYGLRFENKDRNIGDICETSRHNPERDDERDFPEYGTRQYKKLPRLDGTSA